MERTLYELFSVEEIGLGKKYTREGFIIVESQEYQSMCWEFDPGPFFTTYTFIRFTEDSYEGKVMNFEEAKQCYKLVVGRSNRIGYHGILKDIQNQIDYVEQENKGKDSI